ncbi:MAG: carboxylating nicotinate-nucleotide diphosphorylase [Coriobacteriia bacterium]|nr:carboxylating nicotinate-nucleotide diphosphorylase [Coriobacteriia bacterium]MBN2822505.1 carboxylating nicotinate-nucleotide diphosphorylase [Coriobacteriia bacterium]
MYSLPLCDELIASALAEDLGVPAQRVLRPGDASVLDRDVTAASVVPVAARFEGRITARQACVVCGLPVAAQVFEMLARAAGMDDELEFFPLVAEGASVDAGTAVAEISGPARAVLAAERTALDLVMLLSGIATEASKWQAEAGMTMAVTDTRKTLPGLRELSKYAVAVGGAHNHRTGLWDMVLIKDNHIAHAGGITAAVQAARTAHPDLSIEVEADTLAQAVEAARAGADMVLLDNMDDAATAGAVTAVRAACPAGRDCLTEASGGITFDRLAGLRATGVDRVSSSALTLAAPIDFGLDELT